MAKEVLGGRACTFVVTAVTLCAVPHVALAQLRSLHAIRYVTLETPPPGLEQLHQDLAGLWRQQTKLLEASETLDDRLAARRGKIDRYEAIFMEPQARYARCRLRSDLPPPRAIGLECSDYAGKHVGLIRFSAAEDLAGWVRSESRFNLAGAMPLTSVRGVLSGQSPRPGVSLKDVEFMKGLLRTDGKFTVLDSEQGVSADERELLIRFDLYSNAYSINGTVISALLLKDRYGNWVRRFEVERTRSMESTIRLLVDQLFRARMEDEEIYRLPPRN